MMSKKKKSRKPRTPPHSFAIDPKIVLKQTGMLKSDTKINVELVPSAWTITVRSKSEEQSHKLGLRAFKALRSMDAVYPDGPWLHSRTLNVISDDPDVPLVQVEPPGRTLNPIASMPGGSVSGCIAKVKRERKDIDEPGAYCAAIADRIEPGWRKNRSKNMSYPVWVRIYFPGSDRFEQFEREFGSTPTDAELSCLVAEFAGGWPNRTVEGVRPEVRWRYKTGTAPRKLKNRLMR